MSVSSVSPVESLFLFSCLSSGSRRTSQPVLRDQAKELQHGGLLQSVSLCPAGQTPGCHQNNELQFKNLFKVRPLLEMSSFQRHVPQYHLFYFVSLRKLPMSAEHRKRLYTYMQQSNTDIFISHHVPILLCLKCVIVL